jgi:AcrR family transcriptional regulator
METTDSFSDDALNCEDVRTRILLATAAIIGKAGRDGATTRAIATAAGVQAPTIYRLFGDKKGLLDAVAEDGLQRYVAQKTALVAHDDAIEELRIGWDLHIAFGLANPGLFIIMSGDPQSQIVSPSLCTAMSILRRRINNIALAGRLRVTEDRAIRLVHAAGTGIILSLLAQAENQRDLILSGLAREAVIAAITGEPTLPPDAGLLGTSVAMKAALVNATILSDSERNLMGEWLQKIAVAESR